MIYPVRRIVLLLIIASTLLLSPKTRAQVNQLQNDPMGDPVKDISTVGMASLAGAVLGLSTLSFVDEPTGRLENIVGGAALGIIVGVIVVAWGQAHKSQDAYDKTQGQNYKYMPTRERFTWHKVSHRNFNQRSNHRFPHTKGLSFTFAF